MQTLVKQIERSTLNPSALIPIVNDIIEMEKTNLEGKKIIHDELACLVSEYRIAHAELLLSLLRMRSHNSLP